MIWNIYFGKLGDLKNESHFLKKKPLLSHCNLDTIVYLGQTWINDSSDSFNAHVAEVKELARLGIELDQVCVHRMFSRILNLFP